MLQVIDYQSDVKTVVTSDDYIPFSFGNSASVDPTPHYWSSGGSDRQLIEVAVSSENGVIQQVVVVLLGALLHYPDRDSITYTRLIEGVPICEMSRWPRFIDTIDWPKQNYLREEIPFFSTIGKSSLAIQFAQKTEMPLGYCAGEVIFGVDDRGSLLSIEYKPSQVEELGRMLQLWYKGVA